MEQKNLNLELDDSSTTVYWNFDKMYLYVHTKHFENSGQFRESLELEKDILARKDGRKILYEINELVEMSREDRDHIRDEHIPHLVSKGLKFMALVTPHQQVMKDVFVNSIRGTFAEEDLEIQFFDTIEEAEDWLRSK